MESRKQLDNLPINAPLSEATEQMLRPIHGLRNTDHLLIGVSDNGEKFVLTIAPHRRLKTTLLHKGEHQGVLVESITDGTVRQTVSGEPVVAIDTTHVSFQCRDWMMRIPERKFVENAVLPTVKAAMTDYTALFVHKCWPKERIIFEDEDAQVAFTFVLRRFFAQSARASLQARFKFESEVPEMPDDFVDHPTLKLSDYQKTALAMSVFQEGTGLFMEQGTGKTPVGIARICTEARRATRRGDSKMIRVLVVCPRQVCFNWQKEISRFATIEGKSTIIRGGKLKRIKLLTRAIRSEDDCRFSAVILNYEKVLTDIEVLERIPWDLVILDESHKIKSVWAKRWKAMVRLREASRRRMILTGSPIGNTLNDLWTQFEFLGEGLSGFTNFKAFKSFHGKYETRHSAGGRAVPRLLEETNVPLLRERLTRLTFSVTKEEALPDLPDKTYDTWEVEPTKQQEEAYLQLRDELAAEIATGDKISVDHILTKLLRLQQICSGYVRVDAARDPETRAIVSQGRIVPLPGGNPKIDALIEMLTDEENDPNEKTLIWACFIEDIQRIEQKLREAGIDCVSYYGGTSENDREKAVERFNCDPACKVFIANPATAGEGLNLVGYDWHEDEPKLDTYCGHVVWFSQNWSFLQRAQGEDRAHRRGTKMPVRMTDLVMAQMGDEASIDAIIRSRVENKKKRSLEARDVQGILKEALGLEIDLSAVALGA